MNLQLENKTAFISGSTEGIGFAIAKGLAHEGVEVILNGRTDSKLQAAIDRLQAEVPETTISGLTADFRDTAEIEALIKNLPDIDILVNNVGIFASKSFVSTTDHDWKEMLEILSDGPAPLAWATVFTADRKQMLESDGPAPSRMGHTVHQ